MSHYERHNILSNLNHGFRSGFSCESQLLNVTADIMSAYDVNKQVDIAFLDFSKAFDVVPHSYLMKKLEHYGIRNELHMWIGEFLQHRHQSVVVEGCTSSPVEVASGVPQGTCLGPILFLTFINDIATGVNSYVRLFADDCLLYPEISSTEDQLLLQQDLTKLEQWSQKWGMKFNASKCYIVSVSRHSEPRFHRYYSLCDTVLESRQDNPYLGVLISNDGNFTSHINFITARANSTLGFLRRNLKRCPQNMKEMAYFNLVRSKVEYASAIWDPYLAKDVNKLEKVQCQGAQFVKGNYNYRASVTEMLVELKWEPLQDHHKNIRLVLLLKLPKGGVTGGGSYSVS